MSRLVLLLKFKCCSFDVKSIHGAGSCLWELYYCVCVCVCHNCHHNHHHFGCTDSFTYSSIFLPHHSAMESAHLSLIGPIHHFLTHQLCISSFSPLAPSLSLTNSSPISRGFSFHLFLPFHPSASHFCQSSLFLTSFSACVISAGRPSIQKGISMNRLTLCALKGDSGPIIKTMSVLIK